MRNRRKYTIRALDEKYHAIESLRRDYIILINRRRARAEIVAEYHVEQLTLAELQEAKKNLMELFLCVGQER